MRRTALGAVAVLFAVALVSLSPTAGAQATDDGGRGGTPTPAAPPSGENGGATTVSVATEAEYRQAIIDLSTDGSGPHTITVTADFSIATAGDPEYTGTQALTIDGAGHTVTSAVADTSFLYHNASANLSIEDLDIVGFDRDDQGGAIASEAALTRIADSTFTDNTSTTDGGAIDAGGATEVYRSTFTGNESGFDGGAIDQSEEEAIFVSGSTFEANLATAADANGAAVSGEDLGSVMVENSSFTFNEGGSVVYADGGNVLLEYVTLHRNEVETTSDGVVELSGGTLTTYGTVIAFVVGGPGCAGQTTTSSTFSWSDDGSCDFTGTGDTNMGSDPGLEPIADNGGPTETMAIGEDSPLFDAIDITSCAEMLVAVVDQRGEPRPGNASEGCDIGAYELQLADPPVPPTPPTPGGGTGGTGTGPIAGRPGFTG